MKESKYGRRGSAVPVHDLRIQQLEAEVERLTKMINEAMSLPISLPPLLSAERLRRKAEIKRAEVMMEGE